MAAFRATGISCVACHRVGGGLGPTRNPSVRLRPTLGVSFLSVALHHGPCSHFLGASPIASGALGRLLDVLVLTLFLGTDTAQMFTSGHNTGFLVLLVHVPFKMARSLRLLEAAEKQQQEDDQENCSQSTAWVVTPPSTVRPGWQQTDEEDNEYD
jgi:hypothetical protein